SRKEQALRTLLRQVRDELAVVGRTCLGEHGEHELATRLHVPDDARIGVDGAPRAALRIDLQAAQPRGAAGDPVREVALLVRIAPHAAADDGRVAWLLDWWIISESSRSNSPSIPSRPSSCQR